MLWRSFGWSYSMSEVAVFWSLQKPICPYVTQININTACMKQVDNALISLLGKDGTGFNDGVIHRMLKSEESCCYPIIERN
jgi:hypothetical protein